MMELVDLRAISEGYDSTLVEAVGGQVCLDEGAVIQSVSLKLSSTMKSAKDHMRAAQKAARADNKATARKEYDAAIADLKQLQKEAQGIEDDHIIMVAVDAFVKSFVPIYAGCMAAVLIGGGVGLLAELTGMIGGYVCGMSKSLDYSVAVQKKLTPANKQGASGKADPAVWWKVGESRGAVLAKLDRMITACEKGKSELK